MIDYRPAISLYTGLSLLAIAWRVHVAMREVASQQDMGPDWKAVEPGTQLLHAMLQSKMTVLVLFNLGVTLFLLTSLLTKTIFFGKLSAGEAQKLAERTANYVLFKVFFLTAVVEFESMEIALWMAWFALLGYLKMFTGLARDRFERLNASPAASRWAHARTISLLLLVLVFDVLWMNLCVVVFKDAGLSNMLLLLFEATIVAVDTCQTLLQYAVQLSELMGGWLVWKKRSSAEWRGSFLFHANFLMEVASSALTLAHYLHVWWLHGFAFQLIDAVLFLNVRSQFGLLRKRLSGFVRYRKATRNLREAFPDATAQQLQDLNDDCAICKEPMATAKRLPCGHCFHLSCLRSWFDQGAADNYSCPTCRACLIGRGREQPGGAARDSGPSEAGAGVGEAEAATSLLASPQMVAEQEALFAALQASQAVQAAAAAVGVGRLGAATSTPAREGGPFGRWQQHRPRASLHWRGGNGQAVEGSETSRGLREGGGADGEGAQRHFRSWWSSLLSGHDRRARSGTSPLRGAVEQTFPAPQVVELSRGQPVGQRQADNASLVRMLAAVREVLPHLPEDSIRQDLLRTNSVALTLDNLLS